MPGFNENSALLLKTAIDSGITGPAELANIMGNAAVETGNFSRMYEDHRYSSAERLISQVRSAPRRFSMEEIESAVASRDPERIFTVMYENRRDLGNTEPGDGFKYRGRGFFQYTGRANYTEFGEKFDVDLAGNPDLAANPEMAARLAIAYWRDRVPEQSRLDPRLSGEAINGASNGAPDRVARSRDWAMTITPELVEQVRSGAITLEELATISRPAQGDPTVTALQRNLNTLGITDARGDELQPDGNRGGPNSRTNEAIAAFQQQFGLEGRMSNAELLSATQVALSARHAPGVDQALPGVPHELQAQIRQQAAPPSQRNGTTPSSPAELPPLPTAQALEPGDRSAAVQAMQQYLRQAGARDAEGQEIRADRDYGDCTREAVEQFQLWTGRPITGIADPDTLKALQAQAQFAKRQEAQGIDPGQRHVADNLKPAASSLADIASLRTPQDYDTIQDTAAFEQGRIIATVQSGLVQLGYQHRISQPLNINGVNDEATRQAVTAFQAERHLPVTGQPDVATQQALEQALAAQQQAEAREKEKAQEQAQTAPPRTPADPDHPDHALLEKMRGLVRGLNERTGKPWDESSERMSASALVMAKEMRFTERDELQLLPNLPSEKYAAGELLHLAGTGPTVSVDPAANRTWMTAADAVAKPVEDRYQQAQDVAQQQELERQQALARGPDEPSRSGPAR